MAEGQSIASTDSGAGNKAEVIYLKDYTPSPYLIEKTVLSFDLQAEKTVVNSCLSFVRNLNAKSNPTTLFLNGEGLTLNTIAIDGEVLNEARYSVSDAGLTLFNLPEQFELSIETEIDPQKNLSLEGLYLSDGMYCTQCEAEGFRRITYYLDRPDVMSVFSVRVVADKQLYPVLLSNGNPLSQGDLDGGRHWVEWHDPHKKPCYLFALVAGNLQWVEDSFTTMSGRKVALKIFVESKDLNKCGHAMRSLKKSMQWDEQIYGREYDLDLYMIVAVDFFNMGAMENKGLNIFNTSCVLAHPSTQTDAAFQRVEAVIAHEYFHNWSGNRVTCRDWFQLSLKEGFTVFRDACFSADMNSATVKRIEDVSLLRSAQFAEDAGPMAHAIRPESFIEISNFYTLTIYEKGAEVIRMLHQLLGADKFRQGADLYFSRHDGAAVTCEDFVVALEDASGIDLTQFRLWYSQAGTPQLEVLDSWDESSKTYTLTVAQSCPATPGQSLKQPFYLPINMALINQQGIIADSEQMLILNEETQSWTFTALQSKPAPSLLRGFSAPVKLRYDYSMDALLLLLEKETDGFARWDASRRYLMELINHHVTGVCGISSPESQKHIESLVTTLKVMLNDFVAQQKNEPKTVASNNSDAAMLAEILQLPSYQYIIEQFDVIDIAAIHEAVNALREHLSLLLSAEMKTLYQTITDTLSHAGEYQPSANDVGLRSLKNTCLSYLLVNAKPAGVELAVKQYEQANNMTDRLAALNSLLHSDTAGAQQQAARLLEQLYECWSDESLVVNQWLSLQACSEVPGGLARVRALQQHAAYDSANPNKVRALVAAFCMRNLAQFHDAQGEGYNFLADEIIRLDTQNPQLASRLLTPLTQWRRYIPAQQQLMEGALRRIEAVENLSPDVFEVVSKSLASSS